MPGFPRPTGADPHPLRSLELQPQGHENSSQSVYMEGGIEAERRVGEDSIDYCSIKGIF